MKKAILLLLIFLGTGCIVKAQNNCVPGSIHDFNGFLDAFKSIVKLNNGDYITGGGTLNVPYYYFGLWTKASNCEKSNAIYFAFNLNLLSCLFRKKTTIKLAV